MEVAQNYGALCCRAISDYFSRLFIRHWARELEKTTLAFVHHTTNMTTFYSSCTKLMVGFIDKKINKNVVWTSSQTFTFANVMKLDVVRLTRILNHEVLVRVCTKSLKYRAIAC